MPSGQVHAACSIGLSAVCYGTALAFSGDSVLALSCATGCVLGILLTPDLDQKTLSSSENSLVRYTLGLGFLWVMLWYPYASLIPHRSPLSHAPILGTFGRLLYLALLLAIPAWIWRWDFSQISPQTWEIAVYTVIGLAVSDFGHFVFDVTWSRIRPKRRKPRAFRLF